MIVQVRGDRLRLIRQHDHALAAGELAHAWRTASGVLPYRLVAAVGLHDVAWRELDRSPARDPESGLPLGFDAFPLAPKLRAYAAGLDEMEAVDPEVGLLGSLHYASFLDEGSAPEFLASERERQRRLRDRIAARRRAGDGRPGTGEEGAGRRPDAPGARLGRRLEWLKFFDGLSLRLCLAPPGVPDEELPAWLDRGAALSPPAGEEVSARWRGGRRVELAGAALAGPVPLRIPVRDLPRRRFPDDASLDRAWREAPERTWRLRVEPGG